MAWAPRAPLTTRRMPNPASTQARLVFENDRSYTRFMETRRRPGRPRKSSISSVTERAMRAFWDRGYSATSITDLTRATGLHPGGLYNEFGDKRGLFVAALRRYSECGLTRIAQLLTEAPSPIQGIRTYLLAQVELSWSPDGSRGCLMANTTLEILPGDPDLQDIVRRNFADIHTCIAGNVAAAQQVGEMTDRWSADAIASQILTLVEGLFVLGRSAKDPDALLDVVDLTLDSLRPATEQIGQGRR